MEYFLTEEEKKLKEEARRLAENLVLPVRDELDEKGEFPAEIIKEMGRQGLIKIFAVCGKAFMSLSNPGQLSFPPIRLIINI